MPQHGIQFDGLIAAEEPPGLLQRATIPPHTRPHTRHVPRTVIPAENWNPPNRLSGAGRNPEVWVGRHSLVGLIERIESHTSISSSPDILSGSQGGLATGAAPT